MDTTRILEIPWTCRQGKDTGGYSGGNCPESNFNLAHGFADCSVMEDALHVSSVLRDDVLKIPPLKKTYIDTGTESQARAQAQAQTQTQTQMDLYRQYREFSSFT